MICYYCGMAGDHHLCMDAGCTCSNKICTELRASGKVPGAAKVPDQQLGAVALAHALARAVGIQLRPLNKWHKISFYVANCGGTLVTSCITFVPVDEKGEPAGHIKAVLGKQEFPV